MIVFWLLFAKLIPLYVIIALGFVAGRLLHVSKESVAPLILYIITPFVVFHAVATTPITLGVLSLPFLFFITATVIALIFFSITKSIWNDTTRNILAFTSGAGNTGYFGLPVVIALFGEKTLGVAVLCTLGIILYENSVGFFLTARGYHTIKEAFIKVIKLPSLYAFFLGIMVQILNIHPEMLYPDIAANFRGAYSILGMMMIGLGLSSIKHYIFDWKFTTLSFIAKFAVWPIFITIFIVLDTRFLQLYDSSLYKIMILMAIVPLAANTVVVATELKAQPEKAAIAVFLSTMFALFYIPFFSIWYF